MSKQRGGVALAVALLLVSGACSPPDALGIGANAAQGLDVFGVRHEADVFVTAGGLCFDTDATSGKPGPPFVGYQLDVHDETRIAGACGTPEDGPAYALAQTRLNESGVWDAHAVAVVAGGTRNDQNGAFALINFVDTFRVVSSDPDRMDGDAAGISMRVPLAATLTHSTSQVSWTVFADAYRVNDDGSSVFLGRAIDSESDRDGTQTRVLETSLPGARIGDRVQIAGSGVFAFAQMGGSRFLLGPEPKRSEVQATFSLCSDLLGVEAVSTSGSGAKHACAQGDVELVLAEPVQSVFGAADPAAGLERVKLVAGKDSVVRVRVRNTLEQVVDAHIRVEVDQAGTGSDHVFEADVQLPPAPPGMDCTKTFYFPEPVAPIGDPQICATSPAASSFKPMSGPADVQVRAEVSTSGVSETNEDNNSYESPFIPVKVTSLSVTFVQVECPLSFVSDCYGGLFPGEFADAVDVSNRNLLAMYPVAQTGYAGTPCELVPGMPCSIRGSAVPCEPVPPSTTVFPSDCEFLVNDAMRVREELKGVLGSSDRLVAMVPSDYFGYHAPGRGNSGLSELLGYTSPVIEGFKTVSFVRADLAAGHPAVIGNRTRTPTIIDPTSGGITPHEIIHTFTGPLYTHNELEPAGYFVGCQSDLGTPFACEVPEGASNLFNVGETGRPVPETWIHRREYVALLDALKAQPDPALLSIGGLFVRSENGELRVELGGMAELTSGKPSPGVSEGPIRVLVLDDSGQVLAEVDAGDPQFLARFERVFSGVTLEEVDRAVFGATIPYPEKAARLQIRYHEDILVDVDPVSHTLRDAIKDLPDRAYGTNAKQRRKALLNKVNALQKMIAAHKFRGAQNKLVQDIRDKVAKWIVEYERESPSELTQTDLLELVERTSQRLEARMD